MSLEERFDLPVCFNLLIALVLFKALQKRSITATNYSFSLRNSFGPWRICFSTYGGDLFEGALYGLLVEPSGLTGLSKSGVSGLERSIVDAVELRKGKGEVI